MDTKKIFKFPFLEEQAWDKKLAFLVDLTDHLNKLNIQLQAKDILLHAAVAKIKAFIKKLELCLQHIDSNDYTHFPLSLKCDSFSDPDLKDLFHAVVVDLLNEFRTRFDNDSFSFFSSCSSFLSDPKNFSIEKSPEIALRFGIELCSLQEELIEFQSSFVNVPNNIQELWKCCSYPSLRMLALRIFSIRTHLPTCTHLHLSTCTHLPTHVNLRFQQ